MKLLENTLKIGIPVFNEIRKYEQKTLVGCYDFSK